jgi:hypothetical protein
MLCSLAERGGAFVNLEARQAIEHGSCLRGRSDWLDAPLDGPNDQGGYAHIPQVLHD